MKGTSMTTSLKALRSQSGAFDLPSIVIGVVVVGILVAGVLASIFGVIPFAQDKGAQQDLRAINTAEGVRKAQIGAFTDKAGLAAAGLTGPLPAGVTVNAEGAGAGYCATATSPSGKTFAIAAEQTTPWQGDCTFTVNWTKKTPSDNTVVFWLNVAMSSDGRHVLAYTNGPTPYLFTSSDGGATWTRRDVGVSKNWKSVAVSADGKTMMAGQLAGSLFTSTDSGATWVNQPIVRGQHFFSTALSADGRVMITGTSAGLWTSHDAGSTWAKQPMLYQGWNNVAITPDGKVMLAGQNNGTFSPGALYVSTDSGVTWGPGLPGTWSSAGISADGKTMVAGTNGLYISKDYGATWTKAALGGSTGSFTVISADGRTMIAAGYGSYVYTSTDQGTTWKAQTSLGLRDWNAGAVAVSADGKTIVAKEATTGAFFTSTNGGASWTDQGAALGGVQLYAAAVSADGKTIAGTPLGASLWIGSAGRRVTG